MLASPRKGVGRVWKWVGSIAAIVLIALTVTAYYVLHHLGPIVRQRVVDSLSARFQSPVQLDQLHISLFNGLEVSGSGLTVQSIAGPNEPQVQAGLPPLVTVSTFHFNMNLIDLLHKSIHVGTVHLTGLKISLPPKGERPSLKGESNGKKNTIQMDKIVCDDATLTLGTDKPGKIPLEFDISHLVLTQIVPGQAMNFQATLRNPKPVGDIVTNGSFGPWNNNEDHGLTPVSGHYSFSHADLATFKGIGGMLSSTGDYKGVLDAITVDGDTDVPDFYIDLAKKREPLHTHFHALVDGTNGNVTLDPVQARLIQSNFTVRGTVMRAANHQPGHDIQLTVEMPHGRIEDMLQLAVKTDPPLMTGDLKLHTKMEIPPMKERVLNKIVLDGTFDISNAHFSNDKVQQKVDMFSLRAEGKPKQANPAGVAADTNNNDVASEMSGPFHVQDGVITISHLDYEMPGGQALLAGEYSMDGNRFDFHGMVRTKAKLSQMTTGIKSDLLKMADPFFKKNGAGTEIPVRISGTKSEPHFGLDFRHKDGDVVQGTAPPQ